MGYRSTSPLLHLVFAPLIVLLCFSYSWGNEKIRIAYPNSLTAVQVWVAKKQGFFEKNQLDVELLVIPTEIALMSQMAGELDYTIFGTSVPGAVLNGAPLKVVMWLYDRLDYVLVALPRFKTVESLRGKIIGISTYNTSTHGAVRAIFRAHGIDVDKECQVVPMGTGALRFQSILVGKMDATVFPSPRDFFLEEKGMVLLDDVRDKLDWPMTGVTVTLKRLATNRDQVHRVIKSFLEATEFFKENKEASIKLIQDWLSFPRTVAEKSYWKSLRYVSYDGKTREQAVLNLIDATKRNLKKTGEYPVSMFVDYSALNDVLSKR
jgi:ABC-type nitrate/sulfonate/bicarbonate transport system substrate-binding protein